MKTRMMIAAALACVALAIPPIVSAQPSGAVQSQSPLTRDLGAVQRFTAHAAGTVNSADQSGFNVSRVTCTFNQASHTGSPSTTFSIQNKDGASGAYTTLITTTANTADATPNTIHAGTGITTEANVAKNLPIARTWRTTTTIAGSATPIVTGTVGCSVQ